MKRETKFKVKLCGSLDLTWQSLSTTTGVFPSLSCTWVLKESRVLKCIVIAIINSLIFNQEYSNQGARNLQMWLYIALFLVIYTLQLQRCRLMLLYSRDLKFGN